MLTSFAASGRGTGAYSESKGLAIIREDVAKFISERDGNIPIDPENVFLTDGASHVNMPARSKCLQSSLSLSMFSSSYSVRPLKHISIHVCAKGTHVRAEMCVS